MELLSDLSRSMVLQRDRKNVSHQVLVALNTNCGRAWGIYLRSERTDVAPERIQTAPKKLLLPTFQ